MNGIFIYPATLASAEYIINEMIKMVVFDTALNLPKHAK